MGERDDHGGQWSESRDVWMGADAHDEALSYNLPNVIWCCILGVSKCELFLNSIKSKRSQKIIKFIKMS
jgi:hypothetical protein